MSFFITFEGTEGSGKTTQIEELGRCLSELGHQVVLTREPGGCSIADAIRSILLDSGNSAMTPRAELLLYAAARAQHVAEIIVPALKQGKTVLCDRFTDATIAYQGFGRGLCLDLIASLNDMATQGLQPQLTLLLDLPVETGIERALTRIAVQSGPKEDRFERERLEFHRKVQSGYRRLAKQEPSRFRIIDAARPREQVARSVAEEVRNFLSTQNGL